MILLRESCRRAAIGACLRPHLSPYGIWINPVEKALWHYTPTIGAIGNVVPMFEFTLEGLETAVGRLMGKGG